MDNYIDYRKPEKALSLENITVEIGFGSGDYLIKLAEEEPEDVFFWNRKILDSS